MQLKDFLVIFTSKCENIMLTTVAIHWCKHVSIVFHSRPSLVVYDIPGLEKPIGLNVVKVSGAYDTLVVWYLRSTNDYVYVILYEPAICSFLSFLPLLSLRRSLGTSVVGTCTDVLTVTVMLPIMTCPRSHDLPVVRRDLLAFGRDTDVIAHTSPH